MKLATFLNRSNLRILRLEILLAFVPPLIVAYSVINDISLGLSMSGLPVSDSNGWNSCIKSVAYFNTFPIGASDWCMRRPFYPIIAGFFYQFINNPTGLLIFFALIFGVTSAWAFIQVRKILGGIMAALLLVYEWIYWTLFAATQTMTESVGLILGTLGLGFLCKVLINWQLRHLILTVYAFSLASLLRPGNLLAAFCPAILIFAPHFHKRRFVNGLYLLAIPLFLPIIFRSVGRVLGFPYFLHGGNSWATFYGLINGNQDWTVAYKIQGVRNTSSELEMWKIVKEQTLVLLRENPLDLFSNIGTNIHFLFFQNIPFFSPRSVPVNQFITLLNLFMLGILVFVLLRFVFNRGYILSLRIFLCFVILSSFFFYGALLKSDPFRTLSSTQYLFIFTILVLFSSKIPVVQSNPVPIIMASRKRQVQIGFLLTAPIASLSILLLISLNPVSSLNSHTVHPCVTQDSIYIDPRTLEFKKISEIKLPGLYWWEDVIRQLPEGYLLQGLSKNKSGSIDQINIYLQENSVLRSVNFQNSCYTYVPNSDLNLTLAKISFTQALKVN